MPSRLNLEFPDLDAALMRADPGSCRQVAATLAGAAVQQAELTDDAVHRSLDVLRADAPMSPELRSELEELVKRLDEAYWDLQDRAEGGAEMGSLIASAFRRARAANAVLYATMDDAHECAYEASHALRDPDRVRAIAEEALTSLPAGKATPFRPKR